MLRLYSFILILALSFSSFCANAKTSIPKEIKENCKALKKQLGAKDVYPFDTDINAPYYKFVTKDKKSGVVDKAGNIVVPAEYFDVMYFPGHAYDEISVNMLDEENYEPTDHYITILTEPTSATFWGTDQKIGSRIFNEKGQLIRSLPQNYAQYLGNYVFIEYTPYDSEIGSLPVVYHNGKSNNEIVFHSFSNKYNKLGHGLLARTDGSPVIAEVDGFTIKDKEPCVKYSIYDDEMTYYGMKRLDNEGFDIPAKFYALEYRPATGYSEEGWYVTPRSTDIGHETKYQPAETFETGVRDEGEKLYAKQKYDEVLEFYANEGINAPWAKFYSGSALLDKIAVSITFFKLNVEAMEKGSGLPAKNKYHISDPNVIMEALSTIKNFMNSYLASGDTEFVDRANEAITVTDYYVEQMNEYTVRYNNAYGHAAMVTQQQQAQQAAFLSALLDTFTNALSTPIQNNATPSNTYTGGTSVPVSSASNNSSEDNSDRKAFLRGQIADWKNKLRKAEDSYRQALSSGEDTWEKKRVIDSKRQTVDECLQMIKQYESELNSLK